MKVVVTCDHLMTRDAAIEVLEFLVGIYEDVEVYTLVHHPRVIQGPIELHKVKSTYLSNFIQNEEELYKKSYLIPGAANHLPVSCSVDLVLSVSSGLGHGFKICEKTKHVTYLLDSPFLNRKPQSLREKMFRPFLKSWSDKALMNSDEVWVSSDELKNHYSYLGKEMKVFSPGFKQSDFPLFPEGQRKAFPKDFYLVNALGLDNQNAQELIDSLRGMGAKFKFIGRDDHLDAVKSANEAELFYGERSSIEMAPMVAASRALIDLDSKNFFPKMAQASLAAGRPVIALDNFAHRTFLKNDGVIFVKSLNELSNGVKEMDRRYLDFDPEKLRTPTNKYNDIRFKHSIRNRLEKLMS